MNKGNFELLNKEYQKSVSTHKDKIYAQKRKELEGKKFIGPNKDSDKQKEWEKLKVQADNEIKLVAKQYESRIFENYDGSRENAKNQEKNKKENIKREFNKQTQKTVDMSKSKEAQMANDAKRQKLKEQFRKSQEQQRNQDRSKSR